jgi:hypothetical protein
VHLQQRGLLLDHGRLLLNDSGLLLHQVCQKRWEIDARKLIRHAPIADHSSGACS